MKKKLKNILFFIFTLIVVFFFFHLFCNKLQRDTKPVSQETKVNASLNVNGSVLDGQLLKDDTVDSFMQRLMNEGKISFKTRTYVGMGKFVEEINGIRSDGENYWIYYVDNKKATIGISNYKLSPGDVVSWKYEKNAY